MIHISKINPITEKKDSSGDAVRFSFRAITLQGEILEGSNCIVISSNYKRRTCNIKFIDSGESRKLRNISFIELNGVEITMLSLKTKFYRKHCNRQSYNKYFRNYSAA